jgi:hypothetical protein
MPGAAGNHISSFLLPEETNRTPAEGVLFVFTGRNHVIMTLLNSHERIISAGRFLGSEVITPMI